MINPFDAIDKINNSLYITDVISKETGNLITQDSTPTKINCFFHNDSTPSLNVYPEFRGCYCFGCGKTWMPYTFVRDYYKYNFLETIKHFEQIYGLKFEDIKDANQEVGGDQKQDSVIFVVQELREAKVKLTKPIKKAMEIAIFEYYKTGNDSKLWAVYTKLLGKDNEIEI